MLEMNSRLVCEVIGDLWCNKSKLWKEVPMHKMCSGTSVGTDFQPGCCGVRGAGGGPCSAIRKTFVDEGVFFVRLFHRWRPGNMDELLDVELTATRWTRSRITCGMQNWSNVFRRGWCTRGFLWMMPHTSARACETLSVAISRARDCSQIFWACIFRMG